MNYHGRDEAALAAEVTLGLGGQAAAIAAAGKGAGLTASIAATKGAAATKALLGAAGISVNLPLAGWIAAGAMATVAGAISLVTYAKRKTLKVGQVMEIAQELGYPQAAAYPDFFLDAVNSGSAWRQLQAKNLEKKIAKGKGRDWENRSKLQLLGIVEAMDLAQKRAAAGLPPIPPGEAEVADLISKNAQMRKAIVLHRRNRRLIQYTAGVIGIIAVIGILRR